jgi:putative peptidoglycan lipid II flippase
LLIVGPGGSTDAYFAASAVPQLLLTIATGSLGFVLIPLLSSERPTEAGQDVWTFLVVIGGAFAVLALVLGALAPLWFPLAAPGLSVENKALGVQLLRIQLPSLVLTTVYIVLAAALHARQRFVWAEASQLIAALAGFGVAVWVVPRFGIQGAAWVLVVRAAAQAGLVLPALGRFRRPDIHSSHLKDAGRRLRPLLLGAVYTRTDPLVDRFLSSMAPAGGLTLLSLAQQVVVSGAVILGTALAAPVLPQLSVHAKRHEWALFRQMYRQRFGLLAGVGVAAVICIAVIGAVAVPNLPDVGQLTQGDIRTIWILILLLSGVLVGGSVGSISGSAFYAIGDTRTPAVIGVVAYTVGVVLKFVGFSLAGVVGIAIATTCYYALLNVLLHVELTHRVQRRLAHGESRGGLLSTGPVRVLYVLPSLEVGGAERTLLDLLRRIDRGLVDPIVCSLFPGGSLRHEFIAAGIPVVELHAGRGPRQLFGFELLPVLIRLRPRIVHSRLILANLFGRLGRLTGADVISEELGTEDDRLVRSSVLNRVTIGLSNLVATNALEVAERVHFRDGVARKRIRIVRNGVDTARFSPRLTETGREFDVISVCRLDPIKGLMDLVDAAELIRSRRSNFRAVLVGAGPQRHALEERVRAARLDITFAGEQSDIPSWLRRGRVFVLPSHQEGLPNGVMEAMACGLPVVATAVGGTPELVVEGETGRLVAPKHSEALAEAILWYLDDPNRISAHGGAGRARALDTFRMEATVLGYEDLYRELLGGRYSARQCNLR